MKYSIAIVSTVLAAASLFGCNKSAEKAEGTAPQGVATGSEPQIVAIAVNGDGFVPSQIEVKQGHKATLRFTRTTDRTCATAVAFPELKLEKPLPLNQAVDIEVPSDKAQTLTFQCGMGMFKSQVVIR